MQNKFKKGISIILAVLMLLASVPMAGFAGIELPAITVDAGAAISDGDIPEGIIASGICGDNLTWTLDSDGVLTISGTGDMYDYDGRNPWEDNYNELIKTIVLEDGVTSIGECAFWVCDSLTSITIPDSVTSIGPWAFTSCASLTNITIPDSVISIGDSAFSSCTSLISITLPENLTSIGDSAFSGCTSLISITLPENLTNIDDFTFMSCKSLTSITIPDSVTNIGAYAFDECNLLANIEILNPECVIYDDAYTISDTATIYGYENSTAQEYAEKYDRTFISLGAAPGGNITDGDLPAEYGNASVFLESDWNIDENGRFYVDLYVDNSVGMTSWTFDLTFDESVITFYDWADGAAVAECEETKNNEISHVCGNAENGQLRYGGYMHKVMWTPEDFAADAKTNKDANVNPYHCHLLRLYFTVNNPGDCSVQQIAITVSGTVDYSGTYDNNPKYPAVDSKQTSAAIFGNFVPDIVASGTCGDNLTWTLDSTGLLTISGTGDMYDFTQWSENAPWYEHRFSINEVAIEDGVTSIGDYAFLYCSDIVHCSIPDSVTSIGESAFYYCRSLTNIRIPARVTEIKSETFYDCSSLTTVTIGENSQLSNIANYAFFNCHALSGIVIPDNVTHIGTYAFDACSSLVTVTIGENSRLTSISWSAFLNCTSLTGFYVPAGANDVAASAFDGCSSLTDITVAQNNTTYCSVDGVLYNKDKTEIIRYPIGKTASSYTVADGTETIGNGAFDSCSHLESIRIPDGATIIGECAFLGCTALVEIDLPNSLYVIDESAFSNCGLAEITIPASAMLVYYAFGGESVPESITVLSPTCSILFSRNSEALASLETVYGYNGSTAQKFAEQNGITFVSLGEYTAQPLPTERIVLASGNWGDIDNEAYESNLWEFDNFGTLTITGSGRIPPTYKIDAPWYIFNSCIKTVEMGEGITAIEDMVFSDCTSLTSVTIPQSVTRIAGAAFSDCSSLAEITIPDSVTKIGARAFDGTAYYNNASNWENGVLYIGKHLIDAQDSLSGTYTVKDGTLTIADYALAHCDSLTELIIPDSVSHIVKSAFCDCDVLASISILNPDCNYLDALSAGTNTINDYVIIHGYADSTAETFAAELGNSFHILTDADTVEATCTQPGVKDGVYCNACDRYVIAQTAIPSLGHTEEIIPAVAATCTETGLTAGVKCSVCGEILTEQETVPVAAHNLPDVWTVTQNPAIGKAGEECRQCANCDYTETRVIPALTLTVTDREDSGVEFDFADDTFNTDSGDITVIIEKDEEQSAFLLTDYTKVSAWNITFFAEDGSEIQPDATVTVKMPIPDGYNTNSLQLLHIDPTTNESTPVSFTVENGFVIFDAESFSVYVLIDISAVTENEPSAEPNDPSEDCSHLCHKDGILGFFWKILRFFWKLFKMHPVCECGAAHY